MSRTRAEAARAAGVGESTLRGYMQDPEFVRRYQEAFGHMVQDATRQAQQAISPALSTLREVVEDEGQPAQARIQAARTILDQALKYMEISDILERIAKLEEIAGDKH